MEHADRITLAQPDADRQLVGSLEAMYVKGSLHMQSEYFYSDYSGGKTDGSGWGIYGQAGWLFGGHSRTYRPKYGLWAPISAGSQHIFEVFGRASLTQGDDDISSSNELKMLTIGVNWYHRTMRSGINLIATEVDRDLQTEDSGFGIVARFQYLL